MKKLSLFMAAALSVTAFASVIDIEDQAYDLYRLIRREGRYLTQQQSDQVSKLLTQADDIIRGGSSSGMTTFEADCHIDDDTSISYGDFSAIKVRGNAIQDLLNDCKYLATSRFGSYSSYGLKNLSPVSFDAEMVSAECHIDDDTSISFGDFVVGTVVGKTGAEAMDACNSIAKATYGSYSAAGIKNTQVSRFAYGAISAVCEIDDDTSFSAGDFTVGTIRGMTLQEVTEDCKAIATKTFGSYSSSGIKNVTYH